MQLGIVMDLYAFRTCNRLVVSVLDIDSAINSRRSPLRGSG